MQKFTVTHAQKRFDGPDDPPVQTVITVHTPGAHDTERASKVYLTSGPHGCSRDFETDPEKWGRPIPRLIEAWLTGEHAQTVLAVVLDQ